MGQCFSAFSVKRNPLQQFWCEQSKLLQRVPRHWKGWKHTAVPRNPWIHRPTTDGRNRRNL